MGQRPSSSDYPSYFEPYVSKVPDGDLLTEMQTTLEATLGMLASLTDEQANFRYAEDKWSIKELIVHLMDAERVFAFRALSFARGDKTDLPGFDHNAYVPESMAEDRSLSALAEEYTAVRAASIALYKSFGERELSRTGTANKTAVSVLALGYILLGHELHHRKVITEKYISTF